MLSINNHLLQCVPNCNECIKFMQNNQESWEEQLEKELPVNLFPQVRKIINGLLDQQRQQIISELEGKKRETLFHHDEKGFNEGLDIAIAIVGRKDDATK